jgi:hypothetical protein
VLESENVLCMEWVEYPERRMRVPPLCGFTALIYTIWQPVWL